MRALATIDPPPIDRGPSVGTSLIDINYGSRVGIATSITGPTSQALGDYEVIDAARERRRTAEAQPTSLHSSVPPGLSRLSRLRPTTRTADRRASHRIGPRDSSVYVSPTRFNSQRTKAGGTMTSRAPISLHRSRPSPSSVESIPFRRTSRTFSTPACPFAASPHR